MRVDINLASHPYEDQSKFWARWGGGLAALGAVTLVLLYFVFVGWLSARNDRALIREREAQIADREQERAHAEAVLNLPENSSTRDRSQFLNDLFQRKAFSWTQVFEEMERMMPPRLHVVSIQPALGAGNELKIKLVVVGDSRIRALDLVQKMETSQRFRQTQIDQERTEGSQASGNVQFDISALYIPEGEDALTRTPR
jgi:type IV pilus assembly protein PilN